MEDILQEALKNFEKKQKEGSETEILEEKIDDIEQNLEGTEKFDLIKQELNILENEIEKSKFKNRLETFVYDDEIRFSLDNHFLTNISKDTIKSFYCTGDLAKKIIQLCYYNNGIYELKLFIEKYCFISKDFLPIYARISRKEFIDKYLDFLKNELKSNNKINLNNLNNYLSLNYNEKIIKSGSKRWLTHLTFKDKIKINNDGIYVDNSLTLFINDYCVVSNTISPSKRISRATFKKGYIAYCMQNDLVPLDVKSFNNTLQKIYGENFIKSTGIYYMKKIKFKNF